MTYFYIYLLFMYAVMTLAVLKNIGSFKETLTPMEQVLAYVFSPILLPVSVAYAICKKLQ